MKRRTLCLVAVVLLFQGCGDKGTSIEPVAQTLPPDPGPAGLATLSGIDSDGDGVRDDIQRYVALTYPIQNEAGTRNALRQYSKAALASLVDAGNASASRIHAGERWMALQCLAANRPDDFMKVYSELLMQIANTDERVNALLKSDAESMGGDIQTLDVQEWSGSCKPS